MIDPIPEDVRNLIGQPLHERDSEFVVERGHVHNMCAATGNGNPLFWDEAFCQEITGAEIAPPGMLSVWFRPHYWAPGATGDRNPLQTHFDLKQWLELPEAIIAENQQFYGEPVKMGDRMHTREVIRSISEIKRTRLGRGRFWVIDVVCTNQNGEHLGTDRYTAFGYVRGEND